MENILTNLKMNSETRNKLRLPIPDYLIKQKPGGKTKLNYISGAAVTDILNSTFGFLWSWEVKDKWIEQSYHSFNKYVDGVMQKDPSKWIREEQAPVAHVHGKLTVYFKDEKGNMFPISKEACGSKAVIGKQSEQEHIFKSAGTDALKKAASLFGIGLDLYRDDNDTSHFYLLAEEDQEPVWSDEDKSTYEKELNDIYNIIEYNSFTEEDLQGIVAASTDNAEYDLNPGNVLAVHQFMVDNYSLPQESQGE